MHIKQSACACWATCVIATTSALPPLTPDKMQAMLFGATFSATCVYIRACTIGCSVHAFGRWLWFVLSRKIAATIYNLSSDVSVARPHSLSNRFIKVHIIMASICPYESVVDVSWSFLCARGPVASGEAFGYGYTRRRFNPARCTFTKIIARWRI